MSSEIRISKQKRSIDKMNKTIDVIIYLLKQ